MLHRRMPSQSDRAVQFIATCADPKKLKQLAENAAAKGEKDVERAALLRLYEISPNAEAGTLEYDVWRSIHALEGELEAERGKTVRLSRTRQEIARDSELKTVADLITGKASEGFRMLIERQMAQLTFEAVALRHPGRFDRRTLDAARARLAEARVSLADDGLSL